MVYDNYNFFVIGYGPSERASEAIISIAAYARGVGLALLQGATLPDPEGLLEGCGNFNRFLRRASAADLDQPRSWRSCAPPSPQSKVPMPARGPVRTVVKSISAKQRPRRAGASANGAKRAKTASRKPARRRA